jgi:hypothetical protein
MLPHQSCETYALPSQHSCYRLPRGQEKHVPKRRRLHCAESQLFSQQLRALLGPVGILTVLRARSLRGRLPRADEFRGNSSNLRFAARIDSLKRGCAAMI